MPSALVALPQYHTWMFGGDYHQTQVTKGIPAAVPRRQRHKQAVGFFLQPIVFTAAACPPER